MLKNVPDCPICCDGTQLFPCVVEEFPILPEGMELFSCIDCENFFVKESTNTGYRLTLVKEGYYFESDLPWYE